MSNIQNHKEVLIKSEKLKDLKKKKEWKYRILSISFEEEKKKINRLKRFLILISSRRRQNVGTDKMRNKCLVGQIKNCRRKNDRIFFDIIKFCQSSSRQMKTERNTEYCSQMLEHPNPYWGGRLSTVDLLVPASLDWLIFMLKLLLTFVAKQAILMRRSTVLSLPLQLMFPG